MSTLWNAETFLHNVYLDEPAYVRGATSGYSEAALNNDLAGLKQAWKKFQRQRDRDGVYDFLGEVFELV